MLKSALNTISTETMCENVNLPSRAPVVASPEGLTGSTTQVYKMDEICEQCRVQLMLRQRRYIPRP